MPFVRRVSESSLQHIHVHAHKPSIADPEKFRQEKFSLYRYATRLLLERVSWLYRDYYRAAGGGDGRAELIFYVLGRPSRLLRSSVEVRIHWDSVEPDAVSAVAHEQLAGLQIADLTGRTNQSRSHRPTDYAIVGFAQAVAIPGSPEVLRPESCSAMPPGIASMRLRSSSA